MSSPNSDAGVARSAPGAPTPSSVRSALEGLVALAAVATFALTGGLASLALSILGLALLLAQHRRARGAIGVVLLIGAALTALGPPIAQWWVPSPETRLSTIGAAYRDLCRDLRTAADFAAGAVAVPADESERMQAFERLQSLLDEARFEGATILLLDPDGEARAWSGEGLLPEPSPERWPREGLASARSYTAATLVAIAPLETTERPWRVAVGRSLPTDEWPFETGIWSSLSRAAPRWSISDGDAPLRPGEIRVAADDEQGPALWLVWSKAAPGTSIASAVRRTVAAFFAMAFAVAALVEVRRHLRAPDRGPRLLLLLMLIASSAAAVVAADVPWASSAALIAGSAVLGAGLLRHRSAPALASAVVGASGTAAMAMAAAALQRAVGSRPLSAAFLVGTEDTALRLAWLLGTGGLMLLAARLGRGAVPVRWGLLAVATVLAAAAGHDRSALGFVALVVAGATVGLWVRGLGAQGTTTRVCSLVIVALLAATSWEWAYRETLRREIQLDALPQVAPPTAEEVTDLTLSLDAFFGAFDLTSLRPPGRGPVDPTDVAYTLWRGTPLAGLDSLSALVVEPEVGAASSFSFDLPLDRDLELVWDPTRLAVPGSDAWLLSSIEGYTELRLDGTPWGHVRYWLLPRPGFRLGVSEVDELESALLRGRPHRRPADGLPNDVAYAVYRTDGSVVTSPWRAAPPLPSAHRPAAGASAEGTGIMETPAGRSWFWAHRGDDGVTVLSLPLRSARDALSASAVQTLGTLGVVVLLLLAVAAGSLPTKAFPGAVRRVVRSYSKRLLLVYTALLFLPLVALNLLLLRAFEDRLRRDQVAQGEAALDAARTFLVNYIQGLPEGFSYDLLLDQELFAWLSSVVDRQVNLYWRSRLAASSQQALFTAGLLPKRIPGDVFARLSLLGHDIGVRRRHSGELDYLEVYAPVRLGGRVAFVLSVPLLEQQEETTRLLAAMRQQAVLISAGLFLALVALGGRLARGFTTPLMELVDGTRRIAGGADRLGLEPRELELAALVEAIDDMARRIADGRDRLVREKQVVERMVENITSAVVSLDRNGRILLHNRVAADLLDTEIGVELGARLARHETLDPVRAFVASGGDGVRTATASLRLEAGAEPREWTLTWVPLPGGEDPAALLVVDDDTEVVQGQRLAAWAEMARLIAHEIKNPLTPIRLSAEHMRQVWARDPDRFEEVLHRCVDNILRQVEELRSIASDFSTYSRIPEAQLARGDLVAVLGELAGAYRDVVEAGVALQWVPPEAPVFARIDPALLTRAVRNLVENALRAASLGHDEGAGETPDGGASDGPVDPERTVVLALDASVTSAVIRVADRGPGVAPDVLTKMFEPYFSTHDTGTGLGLPIARRIVEEHGGTIEARNRAVGGLEVLITIPLSDSVAVEGRET